MKKNLSDGHAEKGFAGEGVLQAKAMVINFAETFAVFGKEEMFARIAVPDAATGTAMPAHGLVFC